METDEQQSVDLDYTEIPPDVLNPDCPSRQIIKLLADKWVVLVIYALQHEKKRTSQIKYLLGDVSQKMLTQTLRKLEKFHLVNRIVYDQVPPKVEYELTELGYTLVEPVALICEWAKDNFVEVLGSDPRNAAKK